MARKLIYNRAEWEQHVGRFVLAFGDIEHALLSLMGVLPECRIPEAARKIQLATKLEILLEVSGQSSDAEYAELHYLLEQVKGLNSRRNLVAHNTLWFTIEPSDDRGAKFEAIIRSALNPNQTMSFDQMTEITDQADGLATALGDLLVRLIERFDPEAFSASQSE